MSFAKPYWFYSITFFITSFLATLFGVLNLGLLIPLLQVLFNNLSEAQLKSMAIYPQFELKIGYFLEIFNYYFATTTLQYGKYASLQFVAFIIISSVLLSNLFYYISMMMHESLKNNMARNLRKAFFDKLITLHIGYFSDQKKGDLMARNTSDISEIEGLIIKILDILFKHPLAIIIYFTCLLLISIELTIFTLLIIPTSGIVIALIGKKLRKSSNKVQELIGQLNILLDESLTALKVIKSYNASDYIKKRYHGVLDNYIKTMFSIARTREIASPFSEVAGVTIVMSVLLYGGSLILSNNSTLTASAFITYILVFSQILSPAKGMSVSLTNIQRGIASANRVFEVLDTEVALKDIPNAKILEGFQDKIEFKNVNFSYNSNQQILKNISFEIKKGQKVALVGASGGGKSTIAELVTRFYDVTEGQILFDGVDIREVQLESLYAQISIVTQSALFFNDSIFNNIAFGKPNASLEKVEKAAKIANAYEFIQEKKEKYNYNIGDRGVLLSVGQQQRTNIARAVFKDAPILILDEATASLDAKSEKIFQDALEKLMVGKTSLVIAHRLNTIQSADLILVIDKGEIVERGNHQSLMNIENGIYKKLVEMQSVSKMN